MSLITVIIVSFNTRDLLRTCLVSLQGCTLPLRVVVADNASRDGSAAMVREQFPDVELLESPTNLGFAGANNHALRRVLSAECLVLNKNDEHNSTLVTDIDQHPTLNTQHSTLDYVLLLNPDTVVYPGALEALAGFLERHPRVGAVGPRLLNPDGSVQPAAFRFPTLAMSVLDLFPPGEALPGRLYNSWWHGRYPHEPHAGAPYPIDHPLGACILTRRAVLEQVGVFDEQFFMYAEEVDWCYRVRQAGWAIWQEPRAQVMHVGGAATSQFRARMQIALYQSRLRFFRKHYSPLLQQGHRWIIRAGMLRATLRDWRAHACGQLSADELRARLWAYGTITKL